MITLISKYSKKILLASSLLFFTDITFAKGMPKEYYKIKDTDKSKKYFFDYIYNMVEQENIKILNERKFVKSILNSNILSLNFSSIQFKKLLEIKKRYRVKNIYTYSEYSKKIDIVPPSQALAQAAIESGWGKSRFIKEANNIFGHWTYNPRIGMLPKRREIEATHFIRVFKSLQDSISAYMLNLNRNNAYKNFRKKRFEFRVNNKQLDGFALSQTMINYSGIAHEYLDILKNVIKTNNLTNYDTYFYTNLNTK